LRGGLIVKNRNRYHEMGSSEVEPLEITQTEMCTILCTTNSCFFPASTRQQALRAMKKPAGIAGFGFESLVALPGIVSRRSRISHY